MKMTLYEINTALEEVVDDLLDCDEAESEALLAELDALLEARDAKHEAYSHMIRNSEAHAKALKAEAKAFADRAKAQENLAARLKKALLADLQDSGEISVKAGRWKIRRQVSPPQVVVDIDPRDLPAEFMKVGVLPDRTALKHALQSGETIEGTRLERGEHVRISPA